MSPRLFCRTGEREIETTNRESNQVGACTSNSLCGVLCGYGVIIGLEAHFNWGIEGTVAKAIGQLVTAYAAGCFMVMAGGRVAPVFKYQTRLALASVFGASIVVQLLIVRFQLTTDGYLGYYRATLDLGRYSADYARQTKKYANYNAVAVHRYSSDRCVYMKTDIEFGNPNHSKISTTYIERLNLTLRQFNRRFTRLSLGFSKKVENLKYSVALFAAYYNFCWVHGSVKCTPAMAAGIEAAKWPASRLLKIA